MADLRKLYPNVQRLEDSIMDEEIRQALAFLTKDKTVDQMQAAFGRDKAAALTDRLRRMGLVRQYRITQSNVLWFSLTVRGQIKLRDENLATKGE